MILLTDTISIVRSLLLTHGSTGGWTASLVKPLKKTRRTDDCAPVLQYVGQLQRRKALEKMQDRDHHPGGKGMHVNGGDGKKVGREKQKRGAVGVSGAVTESIDTEANQLEQQLQNYDRRLSALRNKLRASVDEKLLGAVKDGHAGGGGGGGKQGGEQGGAAECSEVALVRGVVTSTGQGCKEVIDVSATNKKNTTSHVWKTRPFKSSTVTSSCTLKLVGKESNNVTIRVTFANGESVPSNILFEHAAKAVADFKPLGKVALQKKSVKQLKHVFRLGQDVNVERFLRITFTGSILKSGASSNKRNYHAVSYLNVTGEPKGDALRSSSSSSADGVEEHSSGAVVFSLSSDGLATATRQMEQVQDEDEQHADDGRNAVRSGDSVAPRQRSSRKNVWERLSQVKNSTDRSGAFAKVGLLEEKDVQLKVLF